MMQNLKLRKLLAPLALAVSVASVNAAEETLYFEDRADIPEQYTWDLGLYFEDAEAWDKAFAELEARIPGFASYKGKVGDSPKAMAKALDEMMALSQLMGPLYINAHQKVHLVRGDSLGGDQQGRIVALYAKLNETTSFVEPEIAGLNDKKVRKFRKSKELEPYLHYLDNIWRLRDHTRSPEVEQVLAGSSLSGAGHVGAYESLSYGGIEWPTIKDQNGEDAVVSPGQFGRFMTSTDRDLRQRAFEAHVGAYHQYRDTFASTLGAKVQRDVWLAQVYNYPNSQAAALAATNVPPAVMENLLAAVHDNIDAVAGYDELRRQIIGVDQLQLWDRSVPLLQESGKQYSFAEAWELAMLFWTETFGEEFATIAQQALDQRWVDVYSNEGKRAGAYSWGTWGKPYYLMLNWKGDFQSVSTLVHEMGHSVHGVLASRNQSYHDASVDLFVAEVGSVASQSLFGEWMLERTTDPAERKLLIDYSLTNIRDIFVRQIFFHEFESKMHALAEAGQALTADSLGKIYMDLSDQYYGKVMQNHELNEIYWARISHFYRNFYVWKYATSFAAGEALAARFRRGDKTAAQDYINMLKLGGSVYPLDVLKAGGVDMTDPKVIGAVMERYTMLQQQLADEFGL